MAVSRACFHEKQYIINSNISAVIPQMGVVLLAWHHHANSLFGLAIYHWICSCMQKRLV